MFTPAQKLTVALTVLVMQCAVVLIGGIGMILPGVVVSMPFTVAVLAE